jgi:hypothetical protein
MVEAIRTHKWKIAFGILGAIGTLLSWLAQGVVGKLGEQAFAWFWPYLSSPAFWAVTSAISLALIITIFTYWYYSRKSLELQDMVDASEDIIKLDEQLFWMLPRLLTSQGQHEEVFENILEAILSHVMRLYAPDLSRASILLFDEQDKTLRPYFTREMTEAHKRRTVFDLSGKEDGYGIAGRAYLESRVYVVHFHYNEHKKRWEADTPYYKEFEPGRSHPPYNSFIAVPLKGPDQQQAGVLCLDSMRLDIFDSEIVQARLLKFGKRVAAIIIMHRHLFGASNFQKIGANDSQQNTPPISATTKSPTPRKRRKDEPPQLSA